MVAQRTTILKQLIDLVEGLIKVKHQPSRH